MKDFTDVLVSAIIKQEGDRLDKVMNEVSKKISIDFATEMFKLVDEYYENYDPKQYVRIYGKRGKYLQNRRSPGGVSLHASVTRGGAENADLSKKINRYIDDKVSYVGGIEFDSDYFKDEDNHTRHSNRMKKDDDGNSTRDARITEWNIVENFLFAGEDVGTGDWRSQISYSHPSADAAMKAYMDSYGPTFDRHYETALKNNR